MLTIKYETTFKKDFKRILKRGYNISLMEKVIEMLANQEQLPKKYKDHQLSGDYSDCRECHITPDWLLIYRIVDDELILTLTRTGTHSDLCCLKRCSTALFLRPVNMGDSMCVI